MTVSYFANNSLRHDAEIHKYFIEVISVVLLVEYFKKGFSQLYVTIRVHLFGHIKYKKKFVNLFADRIIRETSKYICFYRTVLFYQIMVEFLLLDFLILGLVRKAWVTSLVFHKTMNFESPSDIIFCVMAGPGLTERFFVLIMSYSDGYLLKVKLYFNGSHEIWSVSEVFWKGTNLP